MNNLEAYELEKPVWTQDDFEKMGWHDAKVWGMLANTEEYELLFDLDYIFKWVHPTGDEKGCVIQSHDWVNPYREEPMIETKPFAM